MNNSNNRILIITGGRIDEDFLSLLLRSSQFDRIIVADHGLTTADRLNIPLDFIVGDFDSVSEEVLLKYQKLSTPIETFPTEKDKTDTQIAVELALMHNPSELVIVGATGSRLDHVLANIHLLMLPMQLDIKACILDTNNKIYLKKESFIITKTSQYGAFVSLLPFTEQVSGISLKGFKYPLNNVTLSAGSSLGISNEIQDEIARVELSKGILIVIEAKD